MVNKYRRKPELWGTPTWMPYPGSDSLSLGCILGAISLVIWYFVIHAFERVLAHSGSMWDLVIVFGGVILGVILIVQGPIAAWKRMKNRREARKSWLAECKSTLLTIVSCHEASWREKQAKSYLEADRYLELQINPDQKAVAPNQATIRADVSRAVYKRLKESSRARIYYQPEAPLTFLLEEEL